MPDAHDPSGDLIHIVHILDSVGVGGAERVTLDLVRNTRRSRFTHTICYLHPPHDFAEDIRRLGYEAICLNAPPRRGWWAAAAAIRRVIRRVRPDVIQTASFNARFANLLARSGSHAPLLNWLVSMDYDDASTILAGWPRRAVVVRKAIDQLVSKVDRPIFVACSQSVADSWKREVRIQEKDVSVICNPVDPATVAYREGRSNARAALSIEADSFVYLTIGRLDAQKDHETLLRGFARVAASQPQSILVIVGSGVLQQVLQDTARHLGVADRVRFIAHVAGVAEVLAAADVFVSSSVIEGLPVSLLEAMMAGLPSIVSDIQPHREAIGSGGVTFTSRGAAGLADQMDRLYSDANLRRELGAAARAAAVARFTLSLIIPQWENAWGRLAGKSRGQPRQF